MLHIKSITKKVLIFALLVTSSIIQAKIIQSDTLACITDYIKQDSIVVCDLDNTLLQPINLDHIGSDQWVEKRFLQERACGLDNTEALNIVLKELMSIYRDITVIPTEATTTQTITTMQEKGIPVIGLTARSVQFAPVTQIHLKQIDITLSTTIAKKAIENCTFDTIVPSCFYQGVLHVGNNNKGTMLGMFLNYINYTPKRIIFIDDKIKNVKTVEQYAQENNIDFVGIHLTALAEKIQSYKDKYFILYNNV